MNQANMAGDRLQKLEAEQRLKAALERLVKGAAHQIEHLAGDLEGGVKASVESITSSVVGGMKEVKAELNVAEAIRRQPLSWVLGAAAAGATLRLLAASTLRPQLALLAGEIGLMVLNKTKNR
jgi:hypothetical protein